MRKASFLFAMILAFGALATVPSTSIATERLTPASSVGDLSVPPPSWYTPELHQKVLASGLKGVEISIGKRADATVEPDCLGYAPPSVSTSGVSVNAVAAGTCMIYPGGCTMNFIFRDSSYNYIGTAGHCVDKGGSVVAQVSSRVDPTDTVFVTLAAIGNVAKKANNGIGKDFGLVRINSGWKVVPGIAGAYGPTGIFCAHPLGQPITHYGHGYIFLVEQGVAKFGQVIPNLDAVIPFTSAAYGYNWVGYGLPGDSGSPVMNDAGLAVGDLTHGLQVAGVPLAGLNFGTTMQGIFNIIGTGYSLVTVDGRSVNCKAPIAGMVGV